MPTGYTDNIYSGKPVSFRQFALGCARAFGALIEMRDAPQDAPIKLNEVSDYSLKTVEKAKLKLAGLAAITSETAEKNAEAEYKVKLQTYQKQQIEQANLKARYEAMLKEVEQWNPPTPEHKGLHQLMSEQLISSISYDACFTQTPPVRDTGKQWLTAQIASSKQVVDIYTKAYAEEVELTENRNRWITDLLDSLPEENP